MTACAMLVRRWVRARSLRRAGALLSAVFAVSSLVFVTVASLQSTRTLQDQRDFGRYAAATYDSVGVGRVPRSALERVEQDVKRVGGHALLQSDQLRPDFLPRTYFQAPVKTVLFVQDSEPGRTWPGRYVLRQGRMPYVPAEVVVSAHLYEQMPDRTRFTVLSGRATFRVVGVFDDKYARQGDEILASPGTWEALRAAGAGRAYQPVEALVRVLFDDADVLPDITAALDRSLPTEGSRAESLAGNLRLRERPEQIAAEAPFGGAQQLVVSYLPLLALAMIVCAVVIALVRRPQLGNARRLAALGVPRRVVLTSQLTAFVFLGSMAIGGGLGVGWLLAVPLRSLVLAPLAEQPLAPIPAVPLRLLAAAALVLLIGATGIAWPPSSAGRSGGRSSTTARGGVQVVVAAVRRAAVVVALVAALRLAADPGSTAKHLAATYLAVAAVLLTAPEVLRAAALLLSGSRPRALVARRLLRTHGSRQVASLLAVAGSLALPASVATQLASDRASAAAASYSRVPPDQIWLQAGSPDGDLEAVERAIAAVPGLPEPVPLRGLAAPPERDGSGGAIARFTRLPNGNYGTSIVAAPGVDALLAAIPALPPSVRNVLEAGGVVDFTTATSDQRIAVYADGGLQRSVTPPLPTLHVRVNRALTQRLAGVMLTETADRLGLPVGPPTAYIYPDSGGQLVDLAVTAATTAGFDAEFVQYTIPPPPPDLPLQAYVFFVGLALGGFAVLLMALSAQARSVRDYSARLVAIGLPPRWVTLLFLEQAGVVVMGGALAGVLAGTAGVLLTASAYATVVVPATPIALAAALTGAAALAAVALSHRNVTAQASSRES